MEHEPFRKAVELALAPDEAPGRRPLAALALLESPRSNYRAILQRNAIGLFQEWEEGDIPKVFYLHLSNVGELDDRTDPELILAAMALMQEVSRGYGNDPHRYHFEGEERLLLNLEMSVGVRTIPLDAQRRLDKGLNHLIAARPTRTDTRFVDSVIYRARALRYFRQGTLFSSREGWKNMWSGRIAAIKELNEIVEKTAGPIPSWVDVAADTRVHRKLTMALIGIAAIAFKSEHGGMPEKLETLVPMYLPSIPVCLVSNQPFRWVDGVILLEGSSWTVKRN